MREMIDLLPLEIKSRSLAQRAYRCHCLQPPRHTKPGIAPKEWNMLMRA